MLLVDKIPINTEREYTEEGFLKVPARISRTGIQNYMAVEMGLLDRDPKEIIKVYRPENEVFDEVSLSSFCNKPVTNNHPPELVNAKNSKIYTIGMSGEIVYRDGMFVKTNLIITDEETISLIESGKVELSNGYTADIDWEEGISPEGEKYDAVQRNIKGNHIAIVKSGRAGPSCRVADNQLKDDGAIMAKITIDDVDYEVSDQAAQAVNKLQSRLKDAEEEIKEKDEEMKEKEDEMEEEKKNAEKAQDSLQAQLDNAKSKIPSSKALDKMISDRMEIIEKAKKLIPDYDYKSKDVKTIMSEVVSNKCPNVNMDSVSEDYIKARFDSLLENYSDNNHFDKEFSNAIINKDEGKKEYVPPSVLARQKMIDENKNAWKPKGE